MQFLRSCDLPSQFGTAHAFVYDLALCIDMHRQFRVNSGGVLAETDYR